MGAVLVQILVSVLLSVLVFISSFSTVWPSYAFKILESDESPIGYKITKSDANLIGSVIMLGSLSSIIFVGFVNEKIGRKRAEILAGLCMTLAWSVITTAKSVTQLVISRFILGFGSGIHLVTALIFIGEIGHMSVKGTLISIVTLMYNIGTLVSYLEGWFCSYEMINYLCLTTVVAFVIAVSFLKETPPYLLRLGKDKEALNSLKFYRGAKTINQDISDEFCSLQQANNNESHSKEILLDGEKEKLNKEKDVEQEQNITNQSPWKILLASKSAQRMIIILSVTIVLGVFMGMIGVQAYAGQFFRRAAPNISPDLCSVLLAVVVCLINLVAVVITDMIPRRDKYEDTDEMPVPWLVGKMSQLHLEVYTHNFTLNYPLGQGQIFSGTNVYGILRAPRTSSLEALVVSAPYRSLSSHQKGTAAGIALMLAFAKFARPQKYWAKDIIFLITEHEQLGMQAWLEAYHGLQSDAETFQMSLGNFWPPGSPSLDLEKLAPGFNWGGDHKKCLNPGKLKGRSGSIQAAINLEFHTPKIKYIEVKIEGLNGQLPNLDLVNLVHKLCVKSGIHHSYRNSYSWIRSRNKMDEWMNGFWTMFDMVVAQIDGVPDGNHGLFHRFGIEAVTLEGREATDAAGPAPRAHTLSTANFYRLGIALESILRSLNNLLERFHQSYFFYLLAATNRFISIGQYMPSLCLLCVAMLIRALSLWVSIQQDGEDETDKKNEQTKKQVKEKDSDSELPEDDKSEEVAVKSKKTKEREVPGDKKSKKVKKSEESSMSVVNIGANYLLVHLIGYAVMNSPVVFSQIGAKYNLPSEVSVYYGLIITSITLTITTPVLPRLVRTGRITIEEVYLVNILVLIELATVCLSVGMHNFPLGFVIAMLYTPLALITSVVFRRQSKLSSIFLFIKRVVCLLVHPLMAVSLGMIGFSRILFPEENFLDMVVRGRDAAMQATMFSIVDSMIYGNWLFNLGSAVLLPIWIIFWQILCTKVDTPT
ncbi:glycosylphosphatidylinositol anchor attachment 1 isoform X2 [Anticarsia gemmatalis]|uniref:glycosylphosphatidylinositol anchor attachment 1 isoform X2 n=1 Tax=Anticarsia gemmatalis TaxID=129554 RepID=UPI003F770F40